MTVRVPPVPAPSEGGALAACRAHRPQDATSAKSECSGALDRAADPLCPQTAPTPLRRSRAAGAAPPEPCHALAVRQPLFGVSTVGYRLEGGFNGPGEPANQWSPWERAGKVPTARAPGGGVWADPGRTLELAAAAGAEVLALSVEWARVEPAPGRLDEGAVDRYASIFASAAERGITPVGVLHDVATPGWLGEEFWLTPGSPDRFAAHAARLVARLGASCRHWVTLRQPNLVALAGWVDGRHPPRRVGALSDAWAVVDNALSAHVLSYTAIHEVQPDAVVLFGLRVSASYDWHRLMVDLLCAPALGVDREELDVWIDARRARHDQVTVYGDLGELARRRLAAATSPFGGGGPPRRGRLRRRSPRRAVDVAYHFAAGRTHAPGSNGSAPLRRGGYPFDALLVVWCPPRAEVAPLPWLRAEPAHLPWLRPPAPWETRPDPGALSAWCHEQQRATPGAALWVEDGFATRGALCRADGWDRRSYLRAQVAAVGSVPVTGYLYFTLEGGGDPTWPDAVFGLGTAPGDRLGADPAVGARTDPCADADFYRRLGEERRGGTGAAAGSG